MLFPNVMNAEHLEEETKLADMMRKTPADSGNIFSSEQWSASKKEFWDIVQKHCQNAEKSLINIGCGYDDNFSFFQEQGNVFINFDMIKQPLLHLKHKCGAKFCVSGDINHIPFRQNVFDFVICIDVIHHEYIQIKSILSNLYTILKPGGTLFLQDPNAWGMFQFYKSIFLPRILHQKLREVYHQIRKSSHRPAFYEFPTNIFMIKEQLEIAGFKQLTIHPNSAYPQISKRNFAIYEIMSRFDYVKKFHNFHYTIQAVK